MYVRGYLQGSEKGRVVTIDPKPARAKSGIQLRYSGIRDPSDEYQTSRKNEIAPKINFRIKKRY